MADTTPAPLLRARGEVVAEQWVEVACRVADVIRHEKAVSPIESLTDLDGTFGEPKVYTMWGFDEERPVMREWRYPAREEGQPDVRPCRHEVVARG